MILFRYLGREVLVSMTAVTVVLLVIIMSGRFVKYLAQVAEGDFAAAILFQVMAYRLPSFMEVVMPLGFYIGILLAYGRLYVENEIPVMHACGFTRKRLIGFTMAPALLVAVLVGYTSLLLSPSGIRAYQQLMTISESSSALKIALEGRFRVDEDSGWVTYIEKVGNGGRMENIFLARTLPDEERDSNASGARGSAAGADTEGQERDVPHPVELIGAASGRFQENPESGERELHLDAGVRNLGVPGELTYRFLRFSSLDMTMAAATVRARRSEVDAMATRELLQQRDPESVAALQWRVSLAVLVPVVALLAIGFSKTNPRQGRYTRLFPAFLVFLIYLVLLNAARDAVAKGNLPLWPGLFWVHLLFLGLALLMIFSEDLKRRAGKTASKSVTAEAGQQ